MRGIGFGFGLAEDHDQDGGGGGLGGGGGQIVEEVGILGGGFGGSVESAKLEPDSHEKRAEDQQFEDGRR